MIRTIAGAAIAAVLLPLTALPALADTGWNRRPANVTRLDEGPVTARDTPAQSRFRKSGQPRVVFKGEPEEFEVVPTVGWKPSVRGHGIRFEDAWLRVPCNANNLFEDDAFQDTTISLGAWDGSGHNFILGTRSCKAHWNLEWKVNPRRSIVHLWTELNMGPAAKNINMHWRICIRRFNAAC